MAIVEDLERLLSRKKDHVYKKSRSRSRSNMAKRKGRSKSHGFGKAFGILKNPMLMKVGLSLGFGTIAALVGSRLSPGNTSLLALGGEYLGGGFEGLIGAEIVKLVAGVPSALSGLGGVLGGQQQTMQQSALTASTVSGGWA